jgi:FMN reductase, NADPH-dependent
MAKILCFCASNSQKSINHDLLVAACELVEGHEKTYSALRDIDLPLYSLDIEAEEGYPEEIQAFYELIEAHDAVIIACPEHNGATPAACKNLIDWGSRYANSQSHKLFADKPVLLLSTSPGEKGGASNLALLNKLLGYQGANIVGQYSRGSYGQHFTDGKADAETQTALREALKPLLAQL